MKRLFSWLAPTLSWAKAHKLGVVLIATAFLLCVIAISRA